MNRKYWLLLSLGPVAASLLVGCSSEFDSCEARRACHADGKAGVGGEAGATGADTAGSGGASVGVAGVEEGDSNGEGGSSGEAGASSAFPALFDACSVKGEFACVGHGSAQRLACDGRLWQAGTTCAANELCDSSNGTCASIVAECASAKPGAFVCRMDTILTCGPDRVTASEGKICEGLCELGVCQAPTCGDKKIEKGEVCDDGTGNADPSGACAKCKAATCGDGVVYEGHEQCDDGNTVSGDGCSAACAAEPVELALGEELSCARSSTGLVKCWGRNDRGQLGQGDNMSGRVPKALSAINLGTGRKAKAISARGASVCALLVDGDVKCWGDNFFGQLGTDDTDHRGDGIGEMGDALDPVPLGAGRKAISVSAGATHTCVVLDGGSVKCWGSGEYGQLGQESRSDVPSPEKLPAAIKLARPATSVSASNYLDASKGGSFGGASCALLDNGKVQCWGYALAVPHIDTSDLDNSGGIGDAPNEMSTLPVLMPGGSPAKSVVVGAVSAAVLDDGSLRLWGRGELLGLGSNQVGLIPDELAALPAVQMGGAKVKSIALGKWHACAILDGGALKCWGRSSYGQLGLGTTDSQRAAPGSIASVDLGGHAALQVATGELHTCAILDNGTVKCWGYNATGALGLEDTDDRLSPATVGLNF